MPVAVLLVPNAAAEKELARFLLPIYALLFPFDSLTESMGILFKLI